MKKLRQILSAAVSIVALGLVAVGTADEPVEIRTTPGAFHGAQSHVQGICCNSEAIFATFSNYVYKLDYDGRVLKGVEAPYHAGDACLANGRLYASMSTADGSALYEYDLDLNLTRKIKLEFCPACDGVVFHKGFFYIGGPSTVETHTKNLTLVYDADFNFVRRGDVDFGVPTTYGPQSIAATDDALFFAFYPDETAPKDAPRSAWVDPETFETLGTTTLDGANGWSVVKVADKTRFLVAKTSEEKNETILILKYYDFDGERFEEVQRAGATK